MEVRRIKWQPEVDYLLGQDNRSYYSVHRLKKLKGSKRIVSAVGSVKKSKRFQ